MKRCILVSALALYALLGGGILVLAGWLIYRILAVGLTMDMVAFITVLFMAFRDVISKMGDVVRAANREAIGPPANEGDE